jgi:C1A family cysteine protease
MASYKYQQIATAPLAALTFPYSIDLRPKMSPVQAQGHMNSCTGFALIAAMEYLENLQGLATLSLSQLFVYYNERLLENSTAQDSGAFMSEGIQVLLQYGACELSLWPYDEALLYTKPSDAAYADALKRRALAYNSISQDQQTLLTTLATYPVAFGLLVYSSFESVEVAHSGLVPVPDQSTETMLGGHAMLIVGYDQGRQCFLVRNSWGPNWGIGGYCWMPYAYVLNPDLCSGFYTITKMESGG